MCLQRQGTARVGALTHACLHLQELDVHSKKRKSDHQYFTSNNNRRQPRDLLVDQSREPDRSRDQQVPASRDSKTQPPQRDHRASSEAVPSSPRRGRRQFGRRYPVPPPDLEDREGPTADQILPVLEDLDDPDLVGGDSVEGDSPVDETVMAGDPTRITMARRGKLVTFYRNGDPYYKVLNTHDHALS